MNISESHRQKFQAFIEGCKEAEIKGESGFIIANPQVIGDTYEEVQINLGLLAEHGLSLHIVAPNHPN